MVEQTDSGQSNQSEFSNFSSPLDHEDIEADKSNAKKKLH